MKDKIAQEVKDLLKPMIRETTVKAIIERHTFLHNQVFDKKPRQRNDKDIRALLNYENKEVIFKS
jgi:hypothetical protein